IQHLSKEISNVAGELAPVPNGVPIAMRATSLFLASMTALSAVARPGHALGPAERQGARTQAARASPTPRELQPACWTPLQLSLLAPVQVAPEHCNVAGTGLALILGRKRRVIGLDLAVGGTVNDETFGMQLSGGVSSSAKTYGFQF